MHFYKASTSPFLKGSYSILAHLSWIIPASHCHRRPSGTPIQRDIDPTVLTINNAEFNIKFDDFIHNAEFILIP